MLARNLVGVPDSAALVGRYDPGVGRRRAGFPVPTEVIIETAFGLLAVALLVGANGFFVAAEFALVAVDRSRLTAQVAQGDRSAARVRGLISRLSFHLSGAQLGITATSLVLGFVAAPVAVHILGPVVEPVLGERAAQGAIAFTGILVATVSQMVLGELIPKTYAIARAESTAKSLAPVLSIYGFVFGPLIRFLNGAANRTVSVMGVEPREELATVRSLQELELIFRASADDGSLARSAAQLLDRSIRLANRNAADTLVPRHRVAALPSDATVVDLVALARRTGYSRFPVHGGDLDDVRGVVHVKAAHTVERDQRATVAVAELATDVLAVPESRELDHLLTDMRDSRHHLAVVVDEHGGTSGIVTLENVIEQIVGDISDEHDTREPRLTRPVRPGEWSFNGGTHCDEVSEETGFVVPEGAYETLAGLVLDRLGHIPQASEAFTEDGWRFVVEEMDRRRVARVRVFAPEAPQGGEDQ